MTNNKILICGSIAFDSIMVFQGQFKDHILPDQIHLLNVSFLVPSLRREFGGIAGNIAYNLKLLGGQALPVGTVGDDGQAYLDRFDQLSIDRRCVMHIKDTHTAQAFITTDLSDNQISAFHPGALAFSSQNRIPDDTGASLALVGPEGRDGMLAHARRLNQLDIPFLFDPGQAMPLLSPDDLAELAGLARYAAFNDYEASLFCSKTGLSPEDLASQLDMLVITRGAEGARLYQGGHIHDIPAARADAVLDPTGCGDAFRGGLLYGISQGMPWETTGRLAAVMGAIKVAHHGGQRHRVSRDEIAQRFHDSYGYPIW